MSDPTHKTLLLATGLFLVVAGSALAGCGKKTDAAGDGASCEALGAHFAELAHAEAATLAADHPEKKAAEAQLALIPKARTALVTECRDEKWSPELRACFAAATSADEFKANCAALAKRVGGDQAAAKPAEPAAAPPPAEQPPTPAPEGGN